MWWLLCFAQHYRKDYQRRYCGSASYIEYDRDAAIEYAWAYSLEGRLTGELNGRFDDYFIWAGRNPSYPSFTYNCANFVSQVLVAGGIPQTDKWHADYVIASHKEYLYRWEMTWPWSVAKSQYEYFSDPDNPYINGEVINIYKPNVSVNEGQINVPLDSLSDNLKSLGIQKGDLMYFYGDGGVHHATVISSVNEGKIRFSANTNNRFDHLLTAALGDSDVDYGVLIVRLNNTIPRGA